MSSDPSSGWAVKADGLVKTFDRTAARERRRSAFAVSRSSRESGTTGIG